MNGTAVAETEEQAPQGSALIQMIERVSVMPNVNVDTLERLLAMQERILDRESRGAYVTALAEMQPRLPVIAENGTIIVREKGGTKIIQSTSYALWEDINEAIRPLLHEFGFALSFRTGLGGDGRITVTGVLSHKDGHQEDTTITLPHDSTGSKNAVQAVGSSTSYGKRYTAMALLNITSRGEDDDGEVGGQLPSAYAAKQGPMGKRAAELANEIKGLEGLGACTAWGNHHASEIAEMPKNWQEMLREDMRAQKEFIRAQTAEGFPGDRLAPR